MFKYYTKVTTFPLFFNFFYKPKQRYINTGSHLVEHKGVIAYSFFESMTKIEIDNIIVKNPRARLNDTINFDITFTALLALPHPISFKVLYVGSAFTQDHDQILEQVQIESVPEPSTLQFTLECPPPQFSKIPREEVICTTAMILSGSYTGNQFIRVGYYIHNSYLGEENHLNVDLKAVVDNSERAIIVEKPRITKFDIEWEGKKREGDVRKRGEMELRSGSKEEESKLASLQNKIQKKMISQDIRINSQELSQPPNEDKTQ